MELVAHRGANWHFPENSMAAFRRALQDGATVLEMDLRRTKDGVIVICAAPVWRGYQISKTRYEVFEKDLVRFEDILTAFPKAQLNVDIETHDVQTVYLIVDLIRAYGAQPRVCIASFNWEVHRWLKDLRYEGCRGLSSFEILLLVILPISLLKSFKFEGRRVQVPPRSGLINFATKWFVEKCHQLKIEVDYWVINRIEQAQHLKKIGADRLMTDDPATLVTLCSP